MATTRVQKTSDIQQQVFNLEYLIHSDATKDEKDRLSKLLGLWQKFKYFKEELLTKLKDPENALSEYQVESRSAQTNPA